MIKRFYALLLKALMILPVALGLLFAGPSTSLRGTLGTDSCAVALSVVRTNFADAQDMLRKAEGLLATVRVSGERDSLRRIISQYRTDLEALQLQAGDLGTAANRLGCTQMRTISVQTQELIIKMRREEARIRLYVGAIRRVNQMIRRTDAALYRASQMVRKADANPESFSILRRAFELQEDAKQKMSIRDVEGALRTTVQARLLVAQTMTSALDSMDVAELKDEARQFYDKTGDMITNAETCITAAGDNRGEKLLSLAREHQERARQAVDAKDPAAAIRHARAARKIVSEINRLCQHVKGADSRLDRLEGKLSQAREIVTNSGNQQALLILDKGNEHVESAKRLLNQGQTEKARLEADIAAKLIAKSVDMAQGDGKGNGSEIALELRKTQVIVNKAGSVAATEEQRADVARAQELVEQARTCTRDRRQCMELLDRATDIAIEVIARRHQIRPDTDDSASEIH